MIENWVGELRLRVRTEVTDTAELRPALERLASAALDRCATLMEVCHPGRVILVRRLPLRWQMEQGMLAEADEVEALARAVVDRIEAMAFPGGLDPPETAPAVLFEDEAQLRASHLLARVQGKLAWFHATLEGPSACDPLATLADPSQRSIAEATLMYLARENRLVEVLTGHLPAVVEVLAAALGCTVTPSIRARMTDRDFGAVAPPVENDEFSFAELAAIASMWPPLPTATRRLALRVHAAVLLNSPIDSAQVVALAATLLEDKPVLSTLNAVVTESPRGSDSAAEPLLPTVAMVPPHHVEGSDRTEAQESEIWIATRYAGLFYLCDRLQELDLGESLWKVCLPEGRVLTAAATALLGGTGHSDPAAVILGGVDRVTDCPEVTLEQLAEVANTSVSSLATALPRRGLADIPSVVVAVVAHPAGQLLTAAAEGLPFVFFAWPADNPETIAAGLKLFLSAWPRGYPLVAEPALVSLDSSGRLQPLVASQPTVLLLPEASTVASASLLTLVAGAPCLLFAARVGEPSPDTVEGFVERYLQRSGRIRTTPERIEVLLRADQADLAVRRAGLDRDPGWLPWLRKDVNFIFEDLQRTPDS